MTAELVAAATRWRETMAGGTIAGAISSLWTARNYYLIAFTWLSMPPSQTMGGGGPERG